MNDEELFVILREHFSSLFPRSCSNCGHRYATLRQYVLETRRLGNAASLDAELGDWKPDQPMGGMALANCLCGSTLALSTEGIPLPQIHGILEWIREQSDARGVGPSEVLEGMRERVRAWALESGTEESAGES